MKCYKCKKEVIDKAVFCPKCGTDLTKKDDCIVCPNCKAKNNIGAIFCEKCGSDLTKKEDCIVCSKCKAKNDIGAIFCEKCGTVLSEKGDCIVCSKCKTKNNIGAIFCDKCGTKLKKEKIKWNFDSIFITIPFLICAVSTTYLLSCPGFVRKLPLDGSTIRFALIVSGIFLILFKNKGKATIKKEIENLKKIRLSKIQIGIMLIIAAIFCSLGLGSKGNSGMLYITPVYVVAVSFLAMIGVIIGKNFSKLLSAKATIGQVFCLIASIFCFFVSIQQNSYGNELNSDYEYQIESFMSSGTINRGNEYITNSRYFMLAGIVFLVLFVVITFCKKKKNN